MYILEDIFGLTFSEGRWFVSLMVFVICKKTLIYQMRLYNARPRGQYIQLI